MHWIEIYEQTEKAILKTIETEVEKIYTEVRNNCTTYEEMKESIQKSFKGIIWRTPEKEKKQIATMIKERLEEKMLTEIGSLPITPNKVGNMKIISVDISD